MAKFLIEAQHADDKADCLRAVQIFLSSGSHFLTNADWGCEDGEHKAWIIVEMPSKEEARMILPPSIRPQAKIVKLTKFSTEDIESMLSEHQP